MKKYNFVTELPSTSNPKKKYTIKMDEKGNLSCSCPSWINNTRRTTPRTCKHTDIIKNAGFSGEKGKFLIIVDRFGTKAPLFCSNYPEECGDCEIRFQCWTTENPAITAEDMKKSRITR